MAQCRYRSAYRTLFRGSEDVDAESKAPFARLNAHDVRRINQIGLAEQLELLPTFGRQLLVHHTDNLCSLIGEGLKETTVDKTDVAVVAVGLDI